jgi:phosphoglycerate-specific signal transduction histidine kinase
MRTIKSKRLIGQKMRCGSQLVDLYINDRIHDMCWYAKSASFDSPMRVEQRRLKVTHEKRAQDAREREAARAEKQMLDNLVDSLKEVSEKNDTIILFVQFIYLDFGNLFSHYICRDWMWRKLYRR